MPAAFTNCISRGGRVRTKSLPNGRYIKICFLNGKSHAGEVHTKKDSNPSSWIKKAYKKKS